MTSTLNGTVSYLMLQRLAEQAWDRGETESLLAFSQAIDSLCRESLNREQQQQQAV